MGGIDDRWHNQRVGENIPETACAVIQIVGGRSNSGHGLKKIVEKFLFTVICLSVVKSSESENGFNMISYQTTIFVSSFEIKKCVDEGFVD